MPRFFTSAVQFDEAASVGSAVIDGEDGRHIARCSAGGELPVELPATTRSGQCANGRIGIGQVIQLGA